MSNNDEPKLLEKYRDTFQSLDKASLISKYCNEHTRIRVSVWNSLSPAPVVIFCYRMLEISGNISENREVITPATDRSVLETDIRTGIGFLVDCFITTEDGAVKHGHTYTKVTLRNNKDGVVVAPLCSGYITIQSLVCWPNGKNESSLEGPGLIRSITGTNPAAGVEVSETVPTNARWRLLAIRTVFVTDATVSNRFVRYTLDDGASIYYNSVHFTTQTAGNTGNHVGTGGSPRATDQASSHQQNLPQDGFLPAGFRITTSTLNLEAGDDFAAPVFMVEEWIEE